MKQTFLVMKLLIPSSFYPEKQYAADFLLNKSLDLNCKFQKTSASDYALVLPDGKSLRFSDAFFSQVKTDSYLLGEYLPQAPVLHKSQFTAEADLPVIFGDDCLERTPAGWNCGADIFASAFFLLSRWEESLIEEKDPHGRVSEDAMYLVKHNLYHRPLADEYAEFLKNMLMSAGYNNFKKPEYQAVFTHDADTLYYYGGFGKLLRLSIGDILKRKSFSMLRRTWQGYYDLKRGAKTDPSDTYDYLADISEKHYTKSHFYFIAGKKGESDLRYFINDTRVGELIRHIEQRGHKVGIHGSYDSFDKNGQLQAEIQRLNQLTAKPVLEGRQHFLRFAVPDTWRRWEAAGLKTDSTLGFRHRIGFRAGTAKAFKVFDIHERKAMNLNESPLIAMDVALLEAYPKPEDGLKAVSDISEKIRRYGGNFVLLWHNDSFNMPRFLEYGEVYEELAERIANPE